MKKRFSLWTLVAVSTAGSIGLGILLSMPASAQQGPDAQGIADSALEQMTAIAAIKDGFTPAQKKIDSNLVFAVKSVNGELAGTSIADIGTITDTVASIASTPETALQSSVTVDIYGNVSFALLDAIASVNGVVLEQSERWGVIRATVPLGSLETIAGNDDVKSIRAAAQASTNVGALTSQGYISHTANQAFAMGVSGAGVTVGVLSDSASAARVAALIASGDLPANTQVLPGQVGPATGTDEGAAMMEIVHDVAPGADLIFATAFNGVASFANNILALQAAGAKVIVDDVTYFNEGVFQDGPIAQAVSQVTALGTLYVSSSANSGSLTAGTSGTWEGDFLPNGPSGAPIPAGGTVHNFRTAASPQNFDVLTAATTFISVKWSDPLGASTNDYDLYLLNSAGTAVVAFSAGAQTGTQDPYEAISNSNGFAANTRIVVVLHSGAPRALHLDTERGRLSINTAGATFGHNAAASTVTTAATYWNSARTGTRPFTGAANRNETFSSDGPRKIFFSPNGAQITPGNVLFATNGGSTLQKPDIAAADGVSTKTPGFLPFFGTSAAAPHAAGIAALVFSARPTWSPADVLNAIKSTALDSMAAGIDRDSGSGIAMAWPAVQFALTH